MPQLLIGPTEPVLDETQITEPTLMMLPVAGRIMTPTTARIDNILTRIRLIEGVATVTQLNAVEDADITHRNINVLIKCHPGNLSQDDFLQGLSQRVRAIHNVELVTIQYITDTQLSQVLYRKRSTRKVPGGF